MNSISITVNQDELNVVRRKLSFQFDKDLTSEETIQFLIEREYDIAKKISFTKKPTHSAEKSDIKNSFPVKIIIFCRHVFKLIVKMAYPKNKNHGNRKLDYHQTFSKTYFTK